MKPTHKHNQAKPVAHVSLTFSNYTLRRPFSNHEKRQASSHQTQSTKSRNAIAKALQANKQTYVAGFVPGLIVFGLLVACGLPSNRSASKAASKPATKL